MDKNKQMVKSILFGAFLGAALTTAGIFCFPNVGLNDETFLLILRAVFGHSFTKHHACIFIGLGTVIGAVIGGFRIKTKKWWVIPSVFIVGIATGGGVVFTGMEELIKRASMMWECSASQHEAKVTLLFLQAIDSGTANSANQFQRVGRDNLSGYIQDVEQWKREGRNLDPITLDTYQAARAYLFPFSFGEKREESFFFAKMLPLAREFVQRNELVNVDFGTNNISKYRINFFQDNRPGGTADLKLKTGYYFDFYSNGSHTEVSQFDDGKTKTYYALKGAPKEKIEAVKALNLQNKLSKTNALKLAENFFKLQRHKDENFHPPELHQSYWSGGEDNRGGELPYYEVKWYRKDVKMADRDAGLSKLPVVIIEVSGIDSHLISYTKAFMPVGSDF